MSAPNGTLCTKTHEYLIPEGNNVYRVGITDHAVHQLGDIVFVELPDLDSTFEKGEAFGTVESVKAASELYMPASGKIVELNETLLKEPELINNDTFATGWFVKIEISNVDDLSDTLEYDEYMEDVEE